MQFNRILKELRIENGYTQTQLANKANLATSCIAMLETNKREPTAQTLISLSEALGVSTDLLLGLEDDFGTRTVAPMGDTGLSSEERKLLNIYQSLSPDMRETLWSLLATWAPGETLKPAKK